MGSKKIAKIGENVFYVGKDEIIDSINPLFGVRSLIKRKIGFGELEEITKTRDASSYLVNGYFADAVFKTFEPAVDYYLKNSVRDSKDDIIEFKALKLGIKDECLKSKGSFIENKKADKIGEKVFYVGDIETIDSISDLSHTYFTHRGKIGFGELEEKLETKTGVSYVVDGHSAYKVFKTFEPAVDYFFKQHSFWGEEDVLFDFKVFELGMNKSLKNKGGVK